jgi:hypothetical protein
MGFFCGMTVVLILVSFCCHLYEFIKVEDWQDSLRDLVLCNLKREVPTSVVFTSVPYPDAIGSADLAGQNFAPPTPPKKKGEN